MWQAAASNAQGVMVSWGKRRQEVLKKETAPRAGERYSVEEERLRQTWDWALKDERTWIWGEGRGVTPDRLATCLDSGGAG